MAPAVVAAAVMLAAGAACAQGAPPAPAAPASAPAPAASSAPLGSIEHPIPKDSPTPPDQAFRLKAGDPNVVSNPPIPDTPQTRATFGQPMSRTGKSTSASGD
jgi:hypothetical protein